MLREIKVVDITTNTVVTTFEANPNDVPEAGDVLIVEENGEIPYLVNGRQFDYRNDVVKLVCEPSDNVTVY